jgi:heavy metal sensor kinase
MKNGALFSPPGIRIQLMLSYGGVFALVMLLFGTLFYARFQETLMSSLDTTLQSQAQEIAGDITYPHNTIKIDDATADLPGFHPASPHHKILPADVNLGILVRVLTSTGRPFRTTPAFYSLHVPADSVMEPLQGEPWQGDVLTSTGQTVRLYSRALTTDDGRIFGVIQVGTALTQIQTALSNVIFQLLLIAPAMLLLAMLGSYWLASLAFTPIRRVINTAQEIKAGDLRRRVPIPRANDEVRHLALTLNDMIDHLEQTFTRQQRFVADASHELRTPVAVIRSKTSMALAHITTPENYIHLFHIIHDEAERLGRLVNDLLTLNRVDEGQIYLECEEVCLDSLVQAVAATVETLADEHQIALHVLPSSTPITIQGDETRLMQMVMNLLENAIQYTDPGGSVSISITKKQEQALLSIRDTGIGIAPEHIPRLFDRFYRIDPARTRSRGGNSGLGLATVNWIVKAHHGTIHVESQPGQGSTFTVSLPL